MKNDDIRKKQELEQAIAAAGDTLPRMIFAMFSGFIRAGFSEQQAMRIVCAYIEGMAKKDTPTDEFKDDFQE
jgi:hypothetical protein